MKLSIITINYNNSQGTIKLLKSLAEQTLRQDSGQGSKDFEIIVVDNASQEADFVNLKSNVGSVALIRNSQNLGFSGGNNVGISPALKNGSDWVVLLNNDTWVESGFLALLKAKLSVLGGVVGLPLDEGGRVAYKGRVEWLKPTLNHVYKPLTTSYLLHITGYFAIGGAMAIHKDVFERTGLWDENYFLYFEDADFSLKAQRAGFKLNFIEEPRVHHAVSESTKKLGSPLLLRYHYRNALYFNWKNGPWHIKLLIWPWSWIIILKQLFKIGASIDEKESMAILDGVIDWYRGKIGKIKLA